MGSPYDTYDYPAYWLSRKYEHLSEKIAIKSLLALIPKIKTTLEIGAGFGRLVPFYSFRAKRIILSDPSVKILGIARRKYRKNSRIEFVHSCLENLPKSVRPKSVDLIIMVRVLHHVDDIESAFKIIHKLLAKNGYFLLEFANKSHLKATFEEFLKGNLTFPLDIFPKEVESTKRAKPVIPFKNFHPDATMHLLKNCGFKLIEKLSVSNVRSAFLKKHVSLDVLLTCEKLLQKPLSLINFGPSVFLLVKKT